MPCGKHLLAAGAGGCWALDVAQEEEEDGWVSEVQVRGGGGWLCALPASPGTEFPFSEAESWILQHLC